ncbi:MAG: hypothetical protein HZA54_03690 [Planctomycetes bacterium]|nr:hypothetical protein [Planctomycetota bacterium]
MNRMVVALVLAAFATATFAVGGACACGHRASAPAAAPSPEAAPADGAGGNCPGNAPVAEPRSCCAQHTPSAAPAAAPASSPAPAPAPADSSCPEGGPTHACCHVPAAALGERPAIVPLPQADAGGCVALDAASVTLASAPGGATLPAAATVFTSDPAAHAATPLRL